MPLQLLSFCEMSLLQVILRNVALINAILLNVTQPSVILSNANVTPMTLLLNVAAPIITATVKVFYKTFVCLFVLCAKYKTITRSS
jgi:hypothetical protein